jgi:periplasmic protein TonB
MTLRSIAIALVLLASATHSTSQSVAASVDKSCEIQISGARTGGDHAARERKLAQLRKQYDGLKSRQDATLRDMPPSKQRDEFEATMAGLEKYYAEIDQQKICSASGPVAKAYIQEMLRRIEECGTRNFPNVQGRSVYGRTGLVYRLDLDGSIESIEIRKSSKNPQIDQHAIAIVRASAPFGTVPDELHGGKFDRFYVYSGFNFYRDRDTKSRPEPTVRCIYP